MPHAQVSAWWIFAGAIVIGACLLLSLASASEHVLAVVGLMVAAPILFVTGFDFIQVARTVYDAPGGVLSVSIGIGLWLTMVAAVGMLVGALMTMHAVQTVGSPGRPRPAVIRAATTSTAAPLSETYWTKDPYGRHEVRWWDGNRYTDQVMDNGVASTDPPGPRAGTNPSGAPATG